VLVYLSLILPFTLLVIFFRKLSTKESRMVTCSV